MTRPPAAAKSKVLLFRLRKYDAKQRNHDAIATPLLRAIAREGGHSRSANRSSNRPSDSYMHGQILVDGQPLHRNLLVLGIPTLTSS